MRTMGYYTDIISGVGAYFGSGFLSMLGAVSVKMGVSASDPFTYLEIALLAAGTILLGAGMVERFFTSHLKAKAVAEDAAEEKAAGQQ